MGARADRRVPAIYYLWPPNVFTGETLVEQVGCYVEITPSGTGLRIWGYGRDKEVETQDIPMPDGGMLQIFRGTHRYLTVTGRIFEDHDGKFKSLDRHY